MTPGDTKGLEFQSVCVLEPGRQFLNLSYEDENATLLEEHLRRTMIDQLRVTLSRATETLAFIDITANPDQLNLSSYLLGDAAVLDAEDLVQHFVNADASAEQRVLACIEDARALLDEKPRRAWYKACQAWKQLGNRELPNGVAIEEVRREALLAVAKVAARFLTSECPAELNRDDVVAIARAALRSRPIVSSVEEGIEGLKDDRFIPLLFRLTHFVCSSCNPAGYLLGRPLPLQAVRASLFRRLPAVSL